MIKVQKQNSTYAKSIETHVEMGAFVMSPQFIQHSKSEANQVSNKVSSKVKKMARKAIKEHDLGAVEKFPE